MAIQPLADRIVVKVSPPKETSKGGILIPEASKEKPQEGTIIAAGPGKAADNGTIVPLEVKAGDVVLFAKYGGVEITTDEGEELLILKESDVLAIVKTTTV